MKKTSLSSRILRYIRNHGGWVNAGEIERLAQSAKYKASNASRRLREMESGKRSDGKECPITLERKIEKGTVWYRAIQPKKIINYRLQTGEIVATKQLW